ncbi:amidase domain-containing protein [Bacillus halotolerans]|uniref:Amidase domain-containing protein n=1 Tax=Bacillus halotolerans TaxID=260554 RepID=A0ABY7I5A2_9BACI|nr:amidase domain-containing protein [Bacillus halotolerans]MBV5121238.1 amidase domain-containing protein [Bacillus halotolerans]MCC2114104.1 amidase domain-containing protein [Bacillus halotolerans]MDG0766296.1 amidase domain-containing protein [Bacillus halotolerans]UUI85243.1 amidase domain-containing protein [Bacillus halotolerans]WAT22295.1 amidase domain-containing protein [Bacillus halotolerans]
MSGGVSLKHILEQLAEERLSYLVNGHDLRQEPQVGDLEVMERKKKLLEKRKIEMIKAKAKAVIDYVQVEDDGTACIRYIIHFEYLYKEQDDSLYMEEQIEERVAFVYDQILIKDQEVIKKPAGFSEGQSIIDYSQEEREALGRAFQYDRLGAVQYAEKYWNKRNPAYKNFSDNCTNFISQCLHAGGAPMRGHPNRGSGWWMKQSSWSYSWTVAHSMKMYLTNSKAGLRAVRVKSAEELVPGDVICYDFEGDGRFNHTTIVVAKDKGNMPLVNAQSYDSRMRYWSYEDSTAYTPSIRYAFFHIVDDTTKE